MKEINTFVFLEEAMFSFCFIPSQSPSFSSPPKTESIFNPCSPEFSSFFSFFKGARERKCIKPGGKKSSISFPQIAFGRGEQMHQTWGKEIFDFFPPDCFWAGVTQRYFGFFIPKKRKHPFREEQKKHWEVFRPPNLLSGG